MLVIAPWNSNLFRLRNLFFDVWVVSHYTWCVLHGQGERTTMEKSSHARGGRPGITLEDVRLAADNLTRQGRIIGPTNIRLELGRGSFNTIQRHLRALGIGTKRQRH